MKTTLPIKIFCTVILLVLLFTSCAEKENVETCLQGYKYGFLGGLWHGLIAPVQFIAMVFGKNVSMYAQNNNGIWYALGFLIGSGGWGFFGGKGLKKSKNNR